MTQMQKEIMELEQLIEYMGWKLANGFYDGSAEPLAAILADMIAIADSKRNLQEETFQQMPWLRKAANR